MADERKCKDCKHDKGRCVGYVRRGSHKNCFEPKVMTNADRIRAMAASDERIADCLLALDIHLAEDGNEFTELYCHGDNNCIDENDDITCNDEMRKTCILRWLQQPAEEVR